MNTDIAITPESPGVHTLDFNPDNIKPIHRKIAKLPKPLRDLINSSLDDGLPARQIIEKLQRSTNPPLPYAISEVNISDWRKTGYLRYIAHQEHLDYVEANREAALEMVASSDNLTLPEATLQIIASQYFETLGDFSPAAMKQKLAEDPLKYTRFLNVFARLVREIVHLNKYRDAKAKAAAEAQNANEDHAKWFEKVDAFMMNSPSKRPEAFHKHHSQPVTTDQNSPSPALHSAFGEGGSSCSDPIPDPSPLSHPSAASSSIEHPESPSSNPSSHPVSGIEHPESDPSPSTPDTRPSSDSMPPSIEHPASAASPEHCLDCHHPLPPLTPEGKRPFERCQVCNILLPPPGTCTRPSADKCHFCGATLPRRLPNGRRPKPTCHNCGIGLGRELEEDLQRFRDPNQPPTP